MMTINHFQQQHCSIIPIQPRGKKPLFSWREYQTRRQSEQEIVQWKQQYPNCNWAMVTGKVSNIVVVDFDTNEAYADAQVRGLPYCPVVKTPRGYHCYFKYQEGLRNFQSRKDLPGVDFRGDGGYVLIPPSIGASGVEYKWSMPNELGHIVLPLPPEWLFEKQVHEHQSELKELYSGVAAGSRNNALARLMGSWVNDQLSLDECFEMAHIWNTKNEIPLDDIEIEQVVESIFKRHQQEQTDTCVISAPESISVFLSRDIPPVDFIVQDILQRGGRTMISAPPNIGKSILVQNIAASISAGSKELLGRFSVKKANVLYLDLEMGEAAISQRFKKILSFKEVEKNSLHIRIGGDIDLLNKNYQEGIRNWISQLGIEVLIIDPIGDAWTGDENAKKEVVQLTKYLDSLRDDLGISILIVHHWRKKSRGFINGGEMASGSYKWTAWLDTHITLDGSSVQNIVMSCAKSRNSAKFDPLLIGINTKSFDIYFKGELVKKFGDHTLMDIYERFNEEWVKVVDLIKSAEEYKICSGDTVRSLLKDTEKFEIDKSNKAHKVRMIKQLNESGKS